MEKTRSWKMKFLSMPPTGIYSVFWKTPSWLWNNPNHMRNNSSLS